MYQIIQSIAREGRAPEGENYINHVPDIDLSGDVYMRRSIPWRQPVGMLTRLPGNVKSIDVHPVRSQPD